MLSFYNLAVNILKSFFEDTILSKDINKSLSQTQIEALVRAIDNGIKKDYDKVLNSISKDIKVSLKRGYNKFIKKGIFKAAPSIQKYKLEDLKPSFKKELNKRVNVCLSFITTQDKQTVEDIKNRFINWASNPHPAKNIKELEKDFWGEIIPETNNKNYQNKNWQKMIVRDQENKMISQMTYLTAMNNNAIGFIWKNRKDSSVVGNPAGKYPKVNSKHNNHWERENKLFLFRDCEALKKGLIKKTKDIQYADELEDGIPGIPINCRCTMRLIFKLYDIPEEYKEIITEKGKEYA